MLKEKIDASETITDVKGLEALCEAMKQNNEFPEFDKYDSAVIDKLDNVLDVYEKLDAVHKRGSINTEEEQYEKDIRKGINEVIEELETKGVQSTT